MQDEQSQSFSALVKPFIAMALLLSAAFGFCFSLTTEEVSDSLQWLAMSLGFFSTGAYLMSGLKPVTNQQ